MKNLRGLAPPLIKFGIFAVVTLLSTAVLAATISNSVSGNTTTYHARFSDAASVNPGDDVRIAGVRVGRVDSISLVDRKVALVTFSVLSSDALPQTVEATIKFRNLIGQRYIALTRGGDPPGPTLSAGATIPVTQTHPAVNLTQLFNGFRPLFQALSPGDVNQLSFELVQVLQGEGGTIDSLLAHTASLTGTLADKDRVIGEVIDNLNSVLDTVNARDDQLTALVITVRQLVSGLARDRNTIGQAISSIGDLTDTTAGLIQDARPPLNGDIRHLGDLAANLNDRRDLVEHFITFLPPKLDALIPLGTYASWFNFYLCDLGGTVTLPTPGAPRLPITVLQNPATRCTANGATAPATRSETSAHTQRSAPGPLTSVPGLGGEH